MKNVVLILLFVLTSLGFAQTLVAEGLNGPMGVLVAPDGSVWIIDSGLGGGEEFTAFFPNFGAEFTANYGDSARIVQVTPDGEMNEIATLPSIVVGQETTGGARLALLNDTVYATSGFWVDVGVEAPDLMSTIVKLEDGEVVEVADAWAFEQAQNPDGFIAESHPYGLLAGPDGSLWVADAGANDLLRVDPMSGEITLVATFDGVPGPLPNPARGDAMESDPVPTGVALGEDGNVYVGFLVGFPFIPGTAKVVQVGSDGSVSDYATGLTSLTDLKLGPDGHLYAVQFAVFSEEGPAPGSGALVRIAEGEASEVVLEGLMFPTAVDFDDSGNAFVVVNGVGAPGSGQVMRYDAVATP